MILEANGYEINIHEWNTNDLFYTDFPFQWLATCWLIKNICGIFFLELECSFFFLT